MPRFVIHEHWSSTHHFDFRLEMEGVLKSWAVPKGPPMDPGTRRLAIAVEDHPLEYGSFEGNIPEGQYGAGRVVIWDHGNYELKEKSPKVIRFELNGSKIKGDYNLIHFKKESGRNQWLLFKSLSPKK